MDERMPMGFDSFQIYIVHAKQIWLPSGALTVYRSPKGQTMVDDRRETKSKAPKRSEGIAVVVESGLTGASDRSSPATHRLTSAGSALVAHPARFMASAFRLQSQTAVDIVFVARFVADNSAHSFVAGRHIPFAHSIPGRLRTFAARHHRRSRRASPRAAEVST